MNDGKNYDVLIIGDLCANDFVLGEHLSRCGLQCRLAKRLSPEARDNAITPFAAYHTHLREEHVLRYRNSLDFLPLARAGRLLVSFTGTLIWSLGRLWLLRSFLGLPPVINFTTGSDMAELSVESSLQGDLFRQYLDFADVNFLVPYPAALENAVTLGLKRAVFTRFPYYILHEEGGIPLQPLYSGEGPLRFFHPSNLDWGIQDPGLHRRSTKGNDRFIRAFARAVNEGLDATCVILDRGPDRAEARSLVEMMGMNERFSWKEHMTKEALLEEMGNAHVVVDQFDVGALGGIAIEAMSLGKPVITYVKESCARLIYHTMPPLLNCHGEDEIYGVIMRCNERLFLEKCGIDARSWALSNHHWKEYLHQFLFYYTLLTGHKVADYAYEN
jgi:glycosyltransferase involved in cell wall biosynthesis